MFNSLLSTFFEIKKNYLFALYSTIVKFSNVKENNLLTVCSLVQKEENRTLNCFNFRVIGKTLTVHHISEIKCLLNDTSVRKGSKSTQISNIPRWAKWIVFVIKLRLLLPCFGLTALCLPTPDPARRPGITPPPYTKHVLKYILSHLVGSTQNIPI